MAAASPSSSSVVSPIAETTTTRSWPAARSRAMRRATRLMRSASATRRAAELLDDEGGLIRHRRGHSTVRESRPRRARTMTRPDPRGGPPMCFDHDSRPPIAPIAGGALDAEPPDPDGRRRHAFAAFRARADDADRRRDHHPARRARPPPVLRGAGAAVRGARHRRRRHRLLRADRRRVEPRGDGFEYMPHVSQTTWAGLGADIRAAAAAPAVRGRRRGAVGLHDRVLHGRPAVVPRRDARAWTSPGVIGLLRLARRPVAQRHAGAGRRGDGDGRRPVLGHLRRRRPGHPGRAVAAFEAALAARRRRPPDRDVPGRPAQLLRPQGGRVRARRARRRGRRRSAFIRERTASADLGRRRGRDSVRP